MRKTVASLFFLVTFTAFGQLTDDSTKQIYSAKTTRIIYEADIKDNQTRERHPDTTLYELESYSEMDVQRHYYQNLGNNGTAMMPVFYPVPEEIGRTSGYYGYDLFVKDPSNFRYYDTKSPYMSIEVVFGGQGRSIADFSYAQNVNEKWNIGFDIFRITSDKQIGRTGVGDRNVVSTSFDVFTYYQHQTKPYSAMLHVIRLDHNVEETGGIYIADLATAKPGDFFAYQDSNIRLNEARASDKRVNWHLYHQYAWQKQLEFYHQFDLKSQTLGYRDFAGGSTITGYDTYGDFYGQFLLGEDSTYSRMRWSEMVNEVGIKGDLANLFYRIYLKRRDIDMDYLFSDPTDRFSENFLGGYTRFDWKDKFNVEAERKILQSGEYELTGRLNSDLIFGSYRSLRAKPGFIYDSYFDNHHYWDHDFESSFTNEITAGLQLKFDWLRFRPKGRLLSLDKFLYFDEDITPQQNDNIAVLASIGGDFDFQVYTDRGLNEAFHFENEVYYTSKSGLSSVNLRVPPLFYNGRFYWRGAWFKNTMNIEIGLAIHAKTNYYAKAYAPEIQQYYLQDEFQIDRFITANAFLNMQVNNLRAFVKLTNANQPTNGGYFVTPYYPGQFRVFDFGVKWIFFD